MNVYFYLVSVVIFSSISGKSENGFYEGKFTGLESDLLGTCRESLV